jgi:hypothetical protein
MDTHPFLSCGSCRTTWETWRDCLLDPNLRLLGMQAVPNLPQSNLLVFEHCCGSSVSVLARRLRFLLEADVEKAPSNTGLPELLGTEECRTHCLHLEDLSACDRLCVNARDRRLAILLAEIKRNGRLPEAITAVP